MIDAGRRSKWRSMMRLDLGVVDPAGPERLDAEADRMGDPDPVGDLDLEPVGEPGRHHVLGYPASGICGRAIDLRRVLAREGAAAMTGHAAVAVDDDLAPGQARIAHRTAGDEPPGRVDVHDRVRPAQLRGDRREDDRLDDLGAQALGPDVRIVLGGDDDGPDPLRRSPCSYSTVTWVLPSGRRYGQLAGLADLRQPARHPMGQRDRQRHQLGRLAAGEPEHHPLVAGTQLERGSGVVADFERGVDALRDVR